MKFNPLLDEFPTNYNGYELNTDFRVGILLTMLFDNEDKSDEDKKLSALLLLYGSEDNIPPELDVAWKGLEWFMSCGYNNCTNSVDSHKETSEEDKGIVDKDGNKLLFDVGSDWVSDDVLDFEFDASRIYSAFLRTYNIDLSTAKMHFFKFIFLLSDLDSDTNHCKVMEIRQTSLRGKKGKELATWLENKRRYAVPVKMSKSASAKMQEVGLDESDLEMYSQF